MNRSREIFIGICKGWNRENKSCRAFWLKNAGVSPSKIEKILNSCNSHYEFWRDFPEDFSKFITHQRSIWPD